MVKNNSLSTGTHYLRLAPSIIGIFGKSQCRKTGLEGKVDEGLSDGVREEE